MKRLIDKKFKCYVSGEYERQTNFIGLLKLLHNYSDFFEYTPQEQNKAIKKWLKSGNVYIDSLIYCKIKRG